MSGLIQPKIELNRAVMPVLVTSNFVDDSLKNERASMETPFSHYKSMGKFLDAQWGLSVAMETRVLIQSVPKPYAAFPPPQ